MVAALGGGYAGAFGRVEFYYGAAPCGLCGALHDASQRTRHFAKKRNAALLLEIGGVGLPVGYRLYISCTRLGGSEKATDDTASCDAHGTMALVMAGGGLRKEW